MVKAGESSKEKTINRRFPVRSEQEAKAKAKAILIKANQSFIEGNCEIMGIPDLRAGSKVNIEGVGKRFEGVYYIKSAKHSISEGGYTTSLSLRRGRAGIV
jgi:phage protein D